MFYVEISHKHKQNYKYGVPEFLQLFCSLQHARQKPLGTDFQRQYAVLVVDLDDINKVRLYHTSTSPTHVNVIKAKQTRALSDFLQCDPKT